MSKDCVKGKAATWKSAGQAARTTATGDVENVEEIDTISVSIPWVACALKGGSVVGGVENGKHLCA